MVKIARFIYTNYFLFLSINAILVIIVQKVAIYEYIIFPSTCLLLAFVYRPQYLKVNILDILFICSLIWLCITWSCNSYENQGILILRCIMSQGAFMSVYLLGRNKHFDSYIFFQKCPKPLLICCILGVLFFINPPNWYIERAYNDYEVNQYNMLEIFRLKSVFPSPYHISYMCGFTTIYIWFSFIYSKSINKENIVYFFSFIITMLLTMMRAPFLSVMLAIIAGIIYMSIYYKSHKILFNVFFFCGLLYIIGLILAPILDLEQMEYLIQKIDTVTSKSDELIDNRLDLGFSYGLIGDGAGRHAIYAYKYGQEGILDSEYVKLLVEQGYVGLAILVLLIIVAIWKCIKYFKSLALELSIILFFVLTMIGADSLSTADKHCFIFWVTIGRVSAFSPKGCCKFGNLNLNPNLL